MTVPRLAMLLLLAACAGEAERDTSRTADTSPTADSGSDTDSAGDPSETGETGCLFPWYYDADGDRFGDPAQKAESCEAPIGYVEAGTDCNDARADVFPGADEVCDGVDQDCDGIADDGATDALLYYADADGDGAGSIASGSTRACSLPSGYAAADDDCDDDNLARHPGADEHCNTIDDDCDGETDEAALDALTWYADVDVDGFGDATNWAAACAEPSGMVGDASDCDDLDPSVNPAAEEHCDEVDEDCNGVADDASVDEPTWYLDVDGDGYGTGALSYAGCVQVAGYAAWSTDCDDTDPTISPGAPELCSGGDEDCDGSVDEDSASDASTWFLDLDHDGFGDAATSQSSCSQPYAYVADSTDCDDTDDARSPGLPEVCDGAVDEDCDGTVDEADASDAVDHYPDADGDGFGDEASMTHSCLPAGEIDDGGDCDDSDSTIHAGAEELANDGIDQDCDGMDQAGVLPSGTYAEADATAAYYSSTVYLNMELDSGAVADRDLDGVGDLAVLGMGDYSLSYTASLFLVPGPLTAGGDVATTATATFTNSTIEGWYVTLEGTSADLDDDAVPDLALRYLIGAATGYLTVIPGGTTGSHDYASPSSFSGYTVSWAANDGVWEAVMLDDWNGDGIADLAVGAPDSVGATNPGRFAVLLGPLAASSTETSTAADYEVTSATEVDFGAHLSAGDVDDDGYTDLVSVGDSSSTAYVCSGNTSGSATDSTGCPDRVTSLSAVGSYDPPALADSDFDGDGRADLTISLYSESTTWIFLSPPVGSVPLTDADIEIDQSAEGMWTSGWLLSGEDIDGGGEELLITGIYGSTGCAQCGSAWLYSDLDTPGVYTAADAVAIYEGTNSAQMFAGWWSALVPDVTGDASPDVLFRGFDTTGATGTDLYQLYVYSSQP